MTTTTPPSVDRLLRSPPLRLLVERFGHDAVLEALRELLAGERARFRAGAGERRPEGWYADRCLELIERFTQPSMRPVFNLTGTVVHTNLGRALLPRAAVDAVVDAALEPMNLEFDIARGRRGERDDHVESLLRELTGAEAATVVNNNAAAVLLVLNTLALRREVLVSRGELIEIGGSFRMPRIMERAGCRLHEVGTTNRTHLDDFREAIGPRTALVMKVHASNYEIRGFTAAADEKAVAALARDHGVPFVVDLGSGSLVDLGRFGLAPEPTPMQAVANGAGLVTFSGDKLLGGPQAGIVVGERALVERLNRNPLKRALRLDKLRMAALAAVLGLYRDPDRLARELPTLRLLTRPLDDIEALGHRLLPAVRERLGPAFQVSVEPCQSQIGSGALPGKVIPSAALAIRPPGRRRTRRGAVQRIAAAFRALPIPVIGRIHDDALLLDLRCLEDEDRFLAQLPLLALTGDDDAGGESRN